MQSRPVTSASGAWWLRRDTLTALPAVLVTFVCCAMPLLWMAAVIVANPNVRREFSLDAFRLGLLQRTLKYNALAAILASLMGLPAGFVLGRARGSIAKFLWVVLPAALLMPSLSYAYGWSQFIRLMLPSLRWLSDHQSAIPLVHALPPIRITFRPNGTADKLRCIWSLAAWLWAVPAGMIGLALRRMDTAIQQQAALDGALRRVTLRQLAGPIIASVAIVTVLATQEFAVYEPTGISVVATEVRMVFDTGSVSSADNSIAAVNPITAGGGMRSPDQAARAAAAVATATPLLICTILLATLAAWGGARSAAADAVAVGEWPPILDTSRWTIAFTLLLLLINIGVPVASLMGSLRNGFSPQRMWGEFAPELGGALFVAGLAALVCMMAALSAGGHWVPGLLAISGASFLVGGQLLAIALIRIYNRRGLDWAYNIAVVPTIAYVGRFGWLAIAAARGTWTRQWQELRDMAGLDGASSWRTTRSIIWPLAWPTLIAGGLLVGALSLTEVPATVLLMPENPQVLTPKLMTWLHMARYDPMIEASLLMMGAVLIPALTAVALAHLGWRATVHRSLGVQ